MSKLLQRYRLWKIERKQERDRRAYQDGYGWAWAAYQLNGMTTEEIEDQATDDHPFDTGAHNAIADIIKTGL